MDAKFSFVLLAQDSILISNKGWRAEFNTMYQLRLVHYSKKTVIQKVNVSLYIWDINTIAKCDNH